MLPGEGGTVAALIRHRAVDPDGGGWLDLPEVAVYKVRGEKVIHSQMFHADPLALVRFLQRAEGS